jgi:hypothetical protein
MDEDGNHCFLKCKKVKGRNSIRSYQIVAYIIARYFELLKLNEGVCLGVLLLLRLANRGEVIRSHHVVYFSMNYHLSTV